MPQRTFGLLVSRDRSCLAAAGWVELRVPSDLAVISPLQELVTQLEAGLSPEVSEAISRAVRAMLCNAVEYGGHLDPAALVEVKLYNERH